MAVSSGFLINARPGTLGPRYRQRARCGGYLFPPDAGTRGLVDTLARSRQPVIADNGAYDAIADVVDTATADQAGSLASRITTAAAAVDSTAQLAEQLAVRPDLLIGPEDITVASWLRAGLADPDLGARRRQVARLNEAVAGRAAALEQLTDGTPCLPVASAFDYDTAYDAGVRFAGAGLHRASIGFGAYMADDRWIDRFKAKGRVRRLPRRLPGRYLRSALVARGFFDGWHSTGAAAPVHFHLLGLGAPIMIPLACLAAASSGAVTFDATSPIRDATEGSLYTSRPASLTLRTWRVLTALSTSSRPAWTCPCWFCRTFVAEHPFDWAAARQVAADRPALGAADLRVGGALHTACPLFAIGTDSLSRDAQRARIGHNHWVVGNLARAFTRPGLRARQVEDHVRRYVDATGSPAAGAAVELGLRIVHPDQRPF